MNNDSLLKEYPIKRIAPVDGMAVTADVWEEAHAYHRAQLRYHALFGHGTGILHGLEVIASDPPDTSVYIRAGMAIDDQGDAIILADPVAFDIGHTADGVLYLLLNYGEGRPRAGGDVGESGAPYYVSSEFSIEALTTLPTNTPFIELARISRRGRTTPIMDAADPLHPSGNEIDQRFRRQLMRAPSPFAGMGVVLLGEDDDENHRHGADRLARAINHSGTARLVVDHNVSLDESLQNYVLVYMVGLDTFKLSAGEMNAIYAYLQGGGTIFYESCRRGVTTGDPSADASFSELLGSIGITLEGLPSGHSLLSEPHLFALPPQGFENQGIPDVKVAEGIIYSAEDYGCLWHGTLRDAQPARGEIRAAYEWGENILNYALARQKEAQGD